MKGLKVIGLYFVLFCAAGWFTQSCNIINPHETVPTYIHIDSFKFVKDSGTLSTLSPTHQITSVWAYYNNTPVGVFDLPATFPVMATGKGSLILYPAISVSGLNNFLSPYAFYRADTSAFEAQPSKVINYTPTTSYYVGVKNSLVSNFPFNSGFKTAQGIGMTIDSNVGTITLSQPNDTVLEYASDDKYTLKLGADAFLELDYKNTVPFYVGIQANLSGSGYVQKIYLAGLNPSDHWQKFYLSLKDFVGQYKGDSYNIYIKAALEDGATSGKVYLNRVQILYFQ